MSWPTCAGTSAQELYAAVMELDREAKASMSIFDPTSLLSRLNRNETDSVDRHIAFNLRPIRQYRGVERRPL